MNKYFFVSLVCFATMTCLARDVEETFLQANRCYQNKKIEKALDLYNSIEHKGSATWHNMGNCAFKLNKYVDALVYWRRAQRNATTKELDDIRKNIDVVGQILGRSIEQSSFWNFVDGILNRFSLFAFQLFFLFAWFGLFVGFWFFKKKRFLLVILLPINLLFGTATVLKHRAQSNPPAIIKESSASLFAGPDKNYHVVGNLNLADEVRVVEQRQDWCKVKADCLVGWVLADKLEVV